MLRPSLGARIFAVVILFFLFSTSAETQGSIRLAVQKTGTFAWELDVIRSHGLDKEAGLSLDVIELASPQAGKIALRGGSVDVILSDWTWVARERALGAPLVFVPYSTNLGAVMVPKTSPIKSLADLKGRKLAVAGGPLDKSWLLLQGALKQDAIDLKTQATIVYGAPSLLAEKALQGEAEATLNYWNICAYLEARGFRRLVDIADLLPRLGAKGRVAMLGYVFDEKWARRNHDEIARFITMTKKAKVILASSDAEWERISQHVGTNDRATLRIYRDRYREGIPHRAIEEEEADARAIFAVLSGLGGATLVGPASEFDPRIFYVEERQN
jgi:NitT/TauT family transport system substrate-binding protein